MNMFWLVTTAGRLSTTVTVPLRLLATSDMVTLLDNLATPYFHSCPVAGLKLPPKMTWPTVGGRLVSSGLSAQPEDFPSGLLKRACWSTRATVFTLDGIRLPRS